MSSPTREAFEMVPDTCPAIDKAAAEFLENVDEFVSASLNDFVDLVVKRQTCALRDALIQALSDKQDAEARAEKLEEQVADLEKDVARLERQLDEARAEAQAMET